MTVAFVRFLLESHPLRFCPTKFSQHEFDPKRRHGKARLNIANELTNEFQLNSLLAEYMTIMVTSCFTISSDLNSIAGFLANYPEERAAAEGRLENEVSRRFESRLIAKEVTSD